MDESVLVVEDSATQAQLLAHVLEGAGFRVHCAVDGQAAMEYLGREVPSLVITDVTMPGMDGFALCRAIRAEERLGNLPVILLTRLADEGKVILGLEAGADSFVSKPFDEERLVQRARELLHLGAPQPVAEPDDGLEVRLSGSSYLIKAGRMRVLNYLVSTYENALRINERLAKAQDELQNVNALLEEKVRARTSALSLEVAQRTEAQNALQATNRLLEIANRHDEVQPLLDEFVAEVASVTGCDAVEICLLDDGGAIASRVHKGFRATDRDGGARVDRILERTVAGLPFCTQGGSFVVGATSRYPTDGSDDDRERLILECQREGYESVALVPIKLHDRILGFARLEDGRENAVHEKVVQMLEAVAKPLGAAIQRIQSEETLRESEERYRLFFQDDLAAALIVTPEGRIVSCNPAFSDLFGFAAPDRAVGSSVDGLYPSPESSQEFLRRLIRERRIAAWETEYRRLDGKRITVIENAVGTFDDQGNLREVRKYFVDVTEKKSLEAQLFQAQKMEAIGRVAGGAAHDFNNMLQVVKGFAAYLMGKPDLPQFAQKPVAQILKATEKAEALTGQLLAFSRKQQEHRERLDLGPVVQGLAEMLRQLVGSDVALKLEAASDLWKVDADPGHIEQVLMNLAANARDAMPQGGELTIATRNAELESRQGDGDREPLATGAYVILTVRDTGTGMDRQTTERMFEPFYTTKEKGKGTGLGLATVYGMVKQSGGSILCHSEVGRGTEFRILFPRAEDR